MKVEQAARQLEALGNPTRLQVYRALSVLEMTESAKAQGLLQELARGPADSMVTGEAQAALERLEQRRVRR